MSQWIDYLLGFHVIMLYLKIDGEWIMIFMMYVNDLFYKVMHNQIFSRDLSQLAIPNEHYLKKKLSFNGKAYQILVKSHLSLCNARLDLIYAVEVLGKLIQ